jgi:AraC-like DNA-binding protein
MPRLKLKLEEVSPDLGSSFRILLTPGLNDQFYWHFHPEYEIVYVEATGGTRHIGDHISRFEGSDLAFIGPNIPHLNFDYGVKTHCEQVVVQMKPDFLGRDFLDLPEFSSIKQLFERARQGLSFYGETKTLVAEKLKRLVTLSRFDQLLELLQVFQLMATSKETTSLQAKPVTHANRLKEQERLHRIYQYIEENYQEKIDVNKVAALCHLTTAAFCRFFKKLTCLTFTDFLNQYRINMAKNLLLQQESVTEACYHSGFDNLSYFNKTFRKLAGENPSQFRKRHCGYPGE